MIFRLVARQEAHKRIIWACAWNPRCSQQFATGSRDKTVKLWALARASVSPVMTLPPFSSGVTALSWTAGILAIGLESGLIELWRLAGADAAASALPAVRIDPLLCHVSAVNRLRWRVASPAGCTVQLASCGADNCVRVLDVALG